MNSCVALSVFVYFVQDFSSLPSAAAAGVINNCLSSKFSDIFCFEIRVVRFDDDDEKKTEVGIKYYSACQVTLITSLDFHHHLVDVCMRR